MLENRIKSNYQGDAYEYKANGIPSAKKFITENLCDPEKATLIDTPVTPYSASVVAGIPLFRMHDLQRDYNTIVHDIRELMPNQFPYDNLRTHIALGVFIRNSPGSGENSLHYTPHGRKQEFYKYYLDIFHDIDFQPFSLKVEGLYPNGIMLFEPAGNEEQVFEIRKQMCQCLLDKKVEKDNLYFETQKDGVQPKIDTGIIHSTFLRFAHREELVNKWEEYTNYLKEANNNIKSGEIFSDPLIIDEIVFIEPRVSHDISTRDWYSDEVIERRRFNDMASEKRIKTIEEMEKIARYLRDHGKKIVTTNGSYDILHGGHTWLLEKAKAEGDVLVMLLNSDDSIRQLTKDGIKSHDRPYIPENQRAKMIASLESVDYVVIFPQNKPLEYLERIKGNIHVKGGSGVPERYREEREFVGKWGGGYKVFNLEGQLSTTNIVKKIRGEK